MPMIPSTPAKMKKSQSLESLTRLEAEFIEPMECLSVSKLPEGSGWVYEINLMGTALSRSTQMAS